MRRLLPLLLVLAATLPRAALAEDMVATRDGLMCASAKALADLTLKNGDSHARSADASPRERGAMAAGGCQSIPPGVTVRVIEKHRNTSLVTYQGRSWTVPNIDFASVTADCVHAGAKVTLTGKVVSRRTSGEDPPPAAYTYTALQLDKPVCFLSDFGNTKDGRYVSLLSSVHGPTVGVTPGRHVTISGTLEAPDNGNQPPEPMMMFDPQVRPTP